MNESPPAASSYPLRWASLAWGAAILIWLSLEDNNAVPVAVLAAGAALLLTAGQTLRRLQTSPLQKRYILPGALLFGVISGAGGAIATALLMLLKTGIHSHLAPDYTFAQMLGMIERAPIWALAGGLLAFGVGLVARYGQQPANTTGEP